MPREFLRPSAQLRSRRSIFSLRSTRSVGVQHLHQGSQHPKQAKLEQNPAEPQDRDIKTSQHGHKKQDNKNNPLTSSDSDADALATNLHLTNSNLSPHYGHPEAAHRKSEYSQLSSVSLKTRKSRLGVESKASIISIEYNAVDELRQLLEEGIDINQPADDGNTPLAVASYHGDFPAVSFLLANGSDPNLATVQGAPPLYWASRNGHALIIQLLCSYGADPNKEARDGLTPLACSALEGHEECCRLLLELNAYPDVGHSDTGETALYWAAHEGMSGCCRVLLETGNADVSLSNNVGETALFVASKNGHVACVGCLLQYGANPDASTWDKISPVFVSAMNSHPKCMKLLLEHGGSPNSGNKAMDRNVNTPMDAALHNLDKTCVSLLFEHGANEDFTIHKSWYATLDADFLGFLLEMDWKWDSKQAMLEIAIRNIRDDQVLLRLLHARLDELNKQSSCRSTIFLLMLEFYLYIIWVHCFISVTFHDINGTEALTRFGGPITMLCVTGIIFLKEIFAARQQGRRYFLDPWNWIDMAAIGLVTTAMVKFTLGHHVLNGESDIFSNIVIAGGAFLCLSFIGYLKTTFLSFSNFVGGVTRICWDLLPFGLVTTIILLVFTFMYYIQRFGQLGYETFGDSFYTVFSSFVGDPESAENTLDIVFGILMIIVLLNVVIAIVTSSWENAVETSLILLVTHRCQLLRRVHDTTNHHFPCLKGEWYIDHKFDEDVEAYCNSIRVEYEFWTGTRNCHPATFLYTFLYVLVNIMRPVITLATWLAGVISVGLLWPRYVRESLVGIKTEKATINSRIGKVEVQTQKIDAQTQRMYDELKTMNEKLPSSSAATKEFVNTYIDTNSDVHNKDTAFQDYQQLSNRMDAIGDYLRRIDEHTSGGKIDCALSVVSNTNESNLDHRLASFEVHVRQIDDDMKAMNAKLDMVLGLLGNAAHESTPGPSPADRPPREIANERTASRPGMPDTSDSLRPDNRREGMQNFHQASF